MFRRLKKLSLALTMFALSACAHGGIDPARTVSDYCLIARPITYDSRQDNPLTVTQVEEHNSKWACVCEGDCPF